MPEYLSPGVYVEEFESGPRPMSGVSTSVPGFLGLAKRGQTEGVPQLITSVADFQRKYGGYLPQKSYENYRFLSYAAEQFFINGGSRCYVMRVKTKGAGKARKSVFDTSAFKLEIGNILTISFKETSPISLTLAFKPSNATGVKILSRSQEGQAGSYKYTLASKIKSCLSDIVVIKAKKNSDISFTPIYTTLKTVNDTAISFVPELPANLTDDEIKDLEVFECNFDMTMKFENNSVKTLENLSFGKDSENYIEKRCNPNGVPISVQVSQKTVSGSFADVGSPFQWIKDSEKHEDHEFVLTQPPVILKFSAKDEGSWGNGVKIEIKPTNRIKAAIEEKVSGDGGYKVKNGAVFEAGDVVAVFYKNTKDPVYNIVNQSSNGIIKFQNAIADSPAPEYLCSCEARLKVSYEDIEEVYEPVSFNINSPDCIAKKLSASSLISIDFLSEELIGQTNKADIKHPFNMLFPGKNECVLIMSEGSDGSLAQEDMAEAFKGDDKTPGKRTGLAAFIDNDIVSIICAPGVTDPSIQAILVSHCENMKNRFAILDIPQDKKSVEKVSEHRETVDSDYAAMYHPWLMVYDPLDKKNIMIPPSGSVAGIYARSDHERGVHKAPANEVVRGILGLDCIYNQGEQSVLNPKGINLIRAFPGQGIRVWGARTCSSNSLWKYVNVRRLFIYLEESIKTNTNWVVFEPNNELLWLRVQRTIDVFLNEVWRSGALLGASPEEAYFVNIGRSTMTQDDIANGRLICVIGVAPVKPAEFVIFRLTQKTMDT